MSPVLLLLVFAAGRAVFEQPVAEAEPTAVDTITTVPRQYSGISFSTLGVDTSVAGVFSRLGAYDPSRWRLAHWLPRQGGYSQVGGGLDAIQRGAGYWLITRDAQTITSIGAPAPADTLELVLGRGPTGEPAWNQLGNPFPFDIAAADWRVVKRDTSTGLGPPFTDPVVAVWTSGDYDTVGVVPARRAFWVRVIDRNSSLAWTRWIAGMNGGNWASIAMGADGNPYIADPFGSVRFWHRVRETWVSEAVPGTSAANWPWLAFDTKGNPAIAYYGGGGSLHLVSRLGSTWTDESVETASGRGYFPSLVFDSQDRPHISYYDNPNGRLLYATKAGGNWSYAVVDGATGQAGCANSVCERTSIALDPQGRPRIAYMNNTLQRLKFAWNDGSGWATETVDTSPSTGWGCAVQVDRTGAPRIAYTDASGALKHAVKAGSTWTIQTAQASGGGSQSYCSLALDAQDISHIAYYESATRQLRHVSPSGTLWATEVADTGAGLGMSSLGINGAGNPRVAYVGGAPSRLMFAEKEAGTVRLRIPHVIASAQGAAAAPAKPGEVSWSVRLVARQGQTESPSLALGAVRGSDIEARLTLAALPTPPGISLSLHVPKQVSGGADVDLIKDFRSQAPRMAWEIELTGADSPGEASITATGFRLPGDVRLFLSDHVAGWVREIVPGQALSFATTASSVGMTVEAVGPGVAVPPSCPLTNGARSVLGNPFADRTGIVLELAEAGDIRATIFDLQGREVRALWKPSLLPGEHVLGWDGADEQGRSLPAGVYLARYQVGASSGTIRLVKLR